MCVKRWLAIMLLASVGCGMGPGGRRTPLRGGVPLDAGDVVDAGDEESDAGNVGPDAGLHPDAGPGSDTDAGIPSGQACRPTWGGTWWLEEGETVRIPLLCASGLALDPAELVADDLPDGASIEPGGELVWRPGLDQAAVWNVTVSVPHLGESATLRLGVADAFDRSGNAPVSDPLTYTEEFGLPVFHIDTDVSIPSNKDYVPTRVTYRGRTWQAQVKYRGATSMAYAKRNFTLDFGEENPFDDAQVAGGFFDRRKLVLITTFDDLTGVRNRLVYELWNRMGPGRVQLPTWSAVVVLNGE